MDYRCLFEILPKAPSTWSTDDVLAWLNFINFNKYGSVFNDKQIDGSCLSMLDQTDLTEELGITSKINIKKIMKWIKEGLVLYEQYILCAQYQTRSIKNNKVNSTKSKTLEIGNIIEEAKEKIDELIITYYEGNQSKFYKISKHGSVIGNHSECDILILEDTVANRHAEVTKKQNQYFLSDLGSKFGTFIKVSEKQLLKKGIIIEMGSFQFEVLEIDTKNKLLKLCVSNGMLGKNLLNYDFKEKSTYCFGRKQTNDFSYEDQHMSGIHAKIYLLNEEFYVEDMQSTNGTWIRISKEYTESCLFSLHHDTIFKIGSVSTYICKNISEKKPKGMKNEESNCMVCAQKKNCFLLPCRHNITCFSCSQKIEQCPLCACEIEERIKIFI